MHENWNCTHGSRRGSPSLPCHSVTPCLNYPQPSGLLSVLTSSSCDSGNGFHPHAFSSKAHGIFRCSFHLVQRETARGKYSRCMHTAASKQSADIHCVRMLNHSRSCTHQHPGRVCMFCISWQSDLSSTFLSSGPSVHPSMSGKWTTTTCVFPQHKDSREIWLRKAVDSTTPGKESKHVACVRTCTRTFTRDCTCIVCSKSISDIFMLMEMLFLTAVIVRVKDGL